MHTLCKNRKALLILGSILLLSGFLRLFALGSVPFVADEFLDVNASYGYRESGQWQAWDFNRDAPSVRTNVASDERAWIYRTQVALLFDRFEPTETTARLTSALWGILTTLILFLVSFSLTRNVWIALIAAFLWAISVPAIEINRKIRMYSMFAPVFLLFSWSLFSVIERSKIHAKTLMGEFFSLQYWYLLPMGLLAALSFHLHALTGNILFILFIYLCIRSIQHRGSASVVTRYLLYVVSLIAVVTVVKYTLPQEFTWFTASIVFFENHYSYIGHILGQYWHPLLGATLIGLGTWYLVKKSTDKNAGLWIAVNFFVILVAAIFLWSRNVGPQYIFFAQTFGNILAAAGIYYIADTARRKLSYHNSFAIVLFLAVLFVPNYGYFFQEDNTYRSTSEGASPNYRKIFDYVKRNTTPGDVMITRNFRNYYFAGLDMEVFDFGSERGEEDLEAEGKVKKVTLAQVRDIVAQHPTGWVVLSDNDEQYITKEARQYFDDHFVKVTDSPLVRGNVSVYRWTTN